MFPALESSAAISLAAALLWGGGDFAGGMGVKYSGSTVKGALRVVLLGHLCSLLVVSVIALSNGSAHPSGAPVVWALCGGAISGISLMVFYIALSGGAMGAAAAVSGLLCALVPALVSASMEGAPGWKKFLGFILAGIAIWMIAGGGTEEVHPDQGTTSRIKTSRHTLLLAIVSGLGFGIYFVSLKMASGIGVFWPMALARVGSTTICSIALIMIFVLSRLRSTGPQALPQILPLAPIFKWTLLGSALDTSANLLFVVAARSGRLDVAAVLSSLYPASTILLAVFVLGEKTTKKQLAGMLVALPAVALIAI